MSPSNIPGFLPPAILLFAALLAAPFPASAEKDASDQVEVIVPESLTAVSSESVSAAGERRGSVSVQSTTGKKIAVVGFFPDGGKPEIEVVNNGRSRVVPVYRKDRFHAQVTLSLGANLIDVRWRNSPGGAWNTKTLLIFRSSKLEGGVVGSYPTYTFHKPDNEEHCQECHQMRLTRGEIETGMEKSCLKCHGALMDNPYVHGPVSVGICTVCHDPDSSPGKYRVQQDDKVLCYSCHDDRKKIDESKRLQHGPVGANMCTVCHDAHSSPFELQLVKPRNEVCLMCHQEDADKWMGRKSLHPPFRDGNCAGCHDPHSSDFTYNLKASRKDLCVLCHKVPIPGHLHEAGKQPQFNLPEDFPLSEDGETMCITCHDPHGAPGAKLTRRDGCDGCHPK